MGNIVLRGATINRTFICGNPPDCNGPKVKIQELLQAIRRSLRLFPSFPVRFVSTVSGDTVAALRAQLTVGSLTPISSAIARSDFAGVACRCASPQLGNRPPVERTPSAAAKSPRG